LLRAGVGQADRREVFVLSEESVDADSVADVDKDTGRLVANFAVESDVCRLAAVVWISVLVADPYRSI
jgi:hypothetical protein